MLLLIKLVIFIGCPVILYAVSLSKVVPEEPIEVQPSDSNKVAVSSEQNSEKQIPDLEADFNIEDLMHLSHEEDTDDL